MYQDSGGRRVRVELDQATRARVERGAQSALLTDRPPRWVLGDTLVVARRWRPVVVDGLSEERQDAPLNLTVNAILVVEPGKLTPRDAQRLGHRTLPDLHRFLVGDGHPLALKSRVERLPLHWLTSWSIAPVDELRILGPTVGYVSSMTSPQMASAGEAIPADEQDEIAAVAYQKWDGLRRTASEEKLRALAERRHKALAERPRRSWVLVSRSEGSSVEEAA